MRLVVSGLVVVGLFLAACAGREAPRAPRPPLGSAPLPQPKAVAPTMHSTGRGVSFAGRDMPLDQVLAQARSSGRPAMLYFVATWCGYCRLLESNTLSDGSVGAHMAAYTNARYDADSPTGRELVRRYGISGFPTLVRVDATGNKVGAFEGYDLPADFVRRIPRP